jgi:uncharacterized protein CbrC (UPF0167 family)
VRCCHWCANDAHKDDRGADQLSDVLIHCLIPKNKTKLMLEKIATKSYGYFTWNTRAVWFHRIGAGETSFVGQEFLIPSAAF